VTKVQFIYFIFFEICAGKEIFVFTMALIKFAEFHSTRKQFWELTIKLNMMKMKMIMMKENHSYLLMTAHHEIVNLKILFYFHLPVA